MKYGKIKDSKIIYYGRADNDKWQGIIEYNDKGERLTAEEMIAKHNLKPITTPTDFNGNYSDYSFVESDTGITVGALTKAARERLQAVELDQLRARRNKECFNIINRGAPWYSLLTDSQKDDLNAWYIQWLNVTATMTVPQVPDSLKEILK